MIIMAIDGRHCYWHAKHHQTPNACGQFGCLAFCEQICRNARRYCKKSKTLRVCCVTFKDSVAPTLFASLGVTKNFAAVPATLMPVQLSVPHWLTMYFFSDAWLTLVQCVDSGENLHWCGRNFRNVWLAFACIQNITPPNPPKSGGNMSPKIGAESTVNKIPAGLIWFIIIVLSYIALNWRHPQFSDTFFGRQRRGSFRMGQLRSGFLAPRGGISAADSAARPTSISISMQWYLYVIYSILYCIWIIWSCKCHVYSIIPFYSIGILYDAQTYSYATNQPIIIIIIYIVCIYIYMQYYAVLYTYIYMYIIYIHV